MSSGTLNLIQSVKSFADTIQRSRVAFSVHIFSYDTIEEFNVDSLKAEFSA